MDTATYIEREGCEQVELRVDYDHGDRTYYYDAEGAVVAVVADNSFGYAACGVIPSCSRNIVRQCRICRGSAVKNDTVPDCPATVWDNL